MKRLLLLVTFITALISTSYAQDAGTPLGNTKSTIKVLGALEVGKLLHFPRHSGFTGFDFTVRAGSTFFNTDDSKPYIFDGEAWVPIGSGTETDPVVAAINGIVKSNGTTISAAVAGTDYVATETDPTVNSIIKNIPVSADATTNKYLNWNGSAYTRKQINYSELTGTPINLYTTDGVISSSTRTVDGNNNGLWMKNLNWFEFDGGNISGTAGSNYTYLTGSAGSIEIWKKQVGDASNYSKFIVDGTSAVLHKNNTTGFGKVQAYNNEVLLSTMTSGTATQFDILANKLYFTTTSDAGTTWNDVDFQIKKLPNSAAAGDNMMVYDPTTYKVGYRAIPSTTITSSTATTLTGILKGNGSTITTAVAGTDYVAPNTSITGATKTKITYDSKGLVTAGADATTSDIAEGTNQYFTTARVLSTALTGYTVGTNTALAATDNILAAMGKIQAQLNNKISSGSAVTNLVEDYSSPSRNLNGLPAFVTSVAGSTASITWMGQNYQVVGGDGNLTDFNTMSPLTTLGDIMYASSANTSSRLAGNTTTTKKFLTQTGTGTVSAAPSWGTISSSDIPDLSTTYQAKLNGTGFVKASGTTISYDNSTYITNPLTTAGDIFIGGVSGTPSRLAIGANGTILGVVSGTLSWQNGASWSGLHGNTGSFTGTGAQTMGTQSFQNYQGAGTATWTLPDRATNAARTIWVKNSSSFNLTVQRAGTDQLWTNAAVNSIVLAPGESISLTSIGGYWTTHFADQGISTGTTTSLTGILKGNGSTITTATAGTDYVATESDPVVKAINGVVKSNGTTISAATSGTDYAPGTSALATGILKSTTTTGALSIAVAGDFPTLNQNTTGSAGSISGTNVITNTNLSQMAANTLKGNNTGSTANAADLTTSQVKTMLALNNVENTALSTWAGSSNITTVGTISTGTWSGTAIAETKGGTNQTTYTLGDMLYSSATNTLSKLAGNTTSTKKFLTQTGNGTVSAAPSWGTLAAGDIPDISATYQTKLSGTGFVKSTAGTISYDNSTYLTAETDPAAIKKTGTTTLTGNTVVNGASTYNFSITPLNLNVTADQAINLNSGTGVAMNGNITLSSYLSGSASPTQTGTKHMLTVDVNGLVGHEVIPSGGGGLSGLTAGNVPYANSSTTIVPTGSTSSNGLFWDNTNNRLGINKNSPAYTLDVSGDIYSSGRISLGSGTMPTWSSNLPYGMQTSLSSMVFNSSDGTVFVTENAYLNSAGTSWVYNSTAAAAQYYQSSGSHTWRTALSGTAGASNTWNGGTMTFDNSGKLLVGYTTSQGSYVGQFNGNLLVSGTIYANNGGTRALEVVNGGGYEMYFNGTGNTNIFSNATTGTMYFNTAGATIAFGNSDGGAALTLSGNNNLSLSTILTQSELSTPSTPAAGTGVWYVNSTDSKPHFKSDGGVDYDLGTAATSVAQASGQLAYGTGTGLTSSSNLKFDNTNKVLGLGGATTHTWAAQSAVIEGDNEAIFMGSGTDLHMMSNAYYDGTWKYSSTQAAIDQYLYQGNYIVRTAASGTADAAITWTDRFKVDNTGLVTIGRLATGGTAPTTTGTTKMVITDANGQLSFANIPSGGGGGLVDGDYGDITVGGTGTTMTIDNLAVTNAKINDVAWSKVTGAPTTLSGYGITDALSSSTTSTQNGYFTDVALKDGSFYTFLYSLTTTAYTANRSLAIDLNNGDRYLGINGDLIVNLGGATVGGTNTGDQFTNTTASRLIGRYAATSGAAQEITVGTGLTLSTGGSLSTSTAVVLNNQANSYTAGNKQTFAANTTNADIRLTGFTSDPSSLSAGDLWYNTTSNVFKGRFNTTTRQLATLDGTETLTNKTINLSSNTLSMTTAQLNTALSDNDVATLAGTETLTNKTIDGNSNTLTNVPNRSKGVSIVAPSSSEQVMLYKAGSNGVTISSVDIAIRGTSPSVTYAISYGSTYGTATSTVVASNAVTTTGGATLNVTSIPANNYIWITTSATSGTVNEFTVLMKFKE